MGMRNVYRLWSAALKDGEKFPVLGTTVPKLLPQVDDTEFDFGDGTNSWDLRIYGSAAANYISWDASANDLKFEDNVSIMFGTGTAAGQGAAGDIEMRWDGTDFDILQATTNSSIKLGISGAGIDLQLYGDTVGADMLWDQSADSLLLGDGTTLLVGSGTARTLNALVPTFQVQGTTVGVDGALAAVLYSATAAEGPEIILARSKSATLGTNTIVANNDSLGRIVAMGADGSTGFDPAAAIVFEVANTPGAATDMPGRILFQTSPDGSQTPATRLTVLSGATTVAQAQLGTAGTSTGALLMAGTTSGVVTLTVGAAAGTWTMQLPAAVGAAGQQLTDAAGNGICTWDAASLGAWKNDLGILDPHDALAAVVSAPTHIFTYNKDVLPVGQNDGNGAQFTGIFAEEAPWAMYGKRDGFRSGIAFSNINAFGYARAAIQAIYEDLCDTIRALPAEVQARLPESVRAKLA